MFVHWLNAFAHDKKLQAVLILIAADLLFGVMSAVKQGTFKLSYIAQFLHDDVLAKVAPWFGLYIFSKAAPGAAVVGVDFNMAADFAFGLATLALVGSLMSSLAEFGISMPAVNGKKE